MTHPFHDRLHAQMRSQEAACLPANPLPGKVGNSCLARLAWVVLIALAMLLPTALRAQVQNGSISGTVTDTEGAVISHAAVTLTQPATGLVIHSRTNAVGTYNFPQLLPGNYTIRVEKKGFEKTQSSVTLTVGQAAQVDVRLPVGSESQTVTIRGDSNVGLDMQTSDLDYTVGSKQVDELPLNGRNPYGLAALAAGIVPGDDFGVGVTVTRGAVVAAATNNFQSNGGIGGSNEVLLDGVSIVVCCQGQPAVTPSAEFVNQFLVVTSAPPAQYGRTSGAILNLATKSGTNQLHGETYDFLRNDKLDAANYFTKRSGVYPYPGHNDFRPPHRANQYGALIDGPIVLPHLYNGKEKSFFTFGYEGVRNLAPQASLTYVPTELMRQGIFTQAPQPVYDPNSYNPSTGMRSPIPAATCGGTAYAAGYCIPPSQFSPVAQALLKFMPEPNLTNNVANYSYVENITESDDQYNFRIDHNFSERQRSFIRGTRSTDSYVHNDLFNTPTGPSAWTQNLAAYLFAIGHVWTVSPNTLLQFSYGFARQTNYMLGQNFYKYNAADYNFSSQFVSEQQIPGLPNITISGFPAMMYGSSFNQWAHYTHSLNATAILQRGKHSISFGYNGRYQLENQEGLGNGVGSFTFDKTFTGGPTPNSALASSQSGYDAWAAFLLGYPSSGSIARQTTVAFNQWVNSLYVQDDWRVLRKLTLNMGLRWDIETGFGERHNHWADFDPTIVNPLSNYVGVTLPGGVMFLGANGNPSRTWPTNYHEFGPRFGLAYAITQNLVVRGGYGLLFLPTSERGYGDPNMGFEQSTNIPSTANGFTPAVSISNPLPNGVLLPVGASAGPGVGVGGLLNAFQYKDPVSYQQQWNFGLERSISTTMSVSLNYVGSHGVDLPQNATLNDLQPSAFSTPGDTNQIAYLQSQVVNPFYNAPGIPAGSVLSYPTAQLALLLTAYPQYATGTISSLQNGSVSLAYLDHGSATYNSFQATFRIQRTSGLNGSVAYVWSKLLGNVSDLTNGFLNTNGNLGYQDYYFMHQHERSILATDVPHRVTGYVIYPLPFGRGQRFFAGMPGWANTLAGGWQLLGVASVSSGFPLSPSVTGTVAFAGTRPMKVPGVDPLTHGPTDQRLGGPGQTQVYLNAAAFTLPQAFQLGDTPRSDGELRGPLTFEDDASVIKTIPIHEALSLELRAEAFNFLNKVDFGVPSAEVGSTNFGIITSQQNLPRDIQLAARLRF